jgi:hypothetical protein
MNLKAYIFRKKGAIWEGSIVISTTEQKAIEILTSKFTDVTLGDYLIKEIELKEGVIL